MTTEPKPQPKPNPDPTPQRDELLAKVKKKNQESQTSANLRK